IHHFEYEVFDSVEELDEQDARLLERAREATAYAYAPYSHFHVAAAARLENGEILAGTNQENASYPVGICAERTLLSAVSSVFPGTRIESIAVTYNSEQILSDHPVAPCGICRQSLQEYESRFAKPIRMILSGMTGKVIVLPAAELLLPFGFSNKELG
ncbi:MAG: cytidine deaminase, partial [Chitinophagaceae bacterium]